MNTRRLTLDRNTPPPQRIKIMRAREFSKLPFPKTQWVVFGLFERGTINMLSAAPNNYKSWLTLQIAISISTGSTLFGFFVVNDTQKVWIINEEDTHHSVQERMNILDKKWSEMPIYYSIQNQVMLNGASVQQIIHTATANNIEFIIFDSLRSIHEMEENSSTEMQKIMNELKKITNAGITVLFTHHNRKKGMFKNGGEPEDSRGSSAINAAVHSHLSCEPKKEAEREYLKITQSKLKGARKMDPFYLNIDIGAETGSFCHDSTIIESTTHGKIVNRIIQCLTEAKGSGINLKGFMSARVGGDRTVREVLKQMEAVKSVTTKTWGEIQNEELKTVSKGIAHNEKFYFLPSAIKEA